MKRAIVEFNDEVLINVLKGLRSEFIGNYEVIENGLPRDTKPIRCEIGNNGLLRVLVESDEFEDVKENQAYPILEPPLLQTRICLCNQGK
jgi:hypothetical protein